MTINGNLLFTGSDDQTIRLWNLQTWYRPSKPLGIPDKELYAAASPRELIDAGYSGLRI